MSFANASASAETLKHLIIVYHRELRHPEVLPEQAAAWTLVQPPRGALASRKVLLRMEHFMKRPSRMMRAQPGVGGSPAEQVHNIFAYVYCLYNRLQI